jgi:hypothetical protein
MGSRVTRLSAARGSEDENVADHRKNSLRGLGQDGETSPCNSDSFGSIPSNKDPGFDASDRKNAPGMTGRKSRRRILIVDDEVAIADTLALIFQLQHYEMRVAYSAEQAIE